MERLEGKEGMAEDKGGSKCELGNVAEWSIGGDFGLEWRGNVDSSNKTFLLMIVLLFWLS